MVHSKKLRFFYLQQHGIVNDSMAPYSKYVVYQVLLLMMVSVGRGVG